MAKAIKDLSRTELWEYLYNKYKEQGYPDKYASAYAHQGVQEVETWRKEQANKPPSAGEQIGMGLAGAGGGAAAALLGERLAGGLYDYFTKPGVAKEGVDVINAGTQSQSLEGMASLPDGSTLMSDGSIQTADGATIAADGQSVTTAEGTTLTGQEATSYIADAAPYVQSAIAAYRAYDSGGKDVLKGQGNREDYARTGYHTAAAVLPFFGPPGMIASALMELGTPVFERGVVAPLGKDNKSGYTDLGFNALMASNPFTAPLAAINAFSDKLGMKSLGEALFGKHEDIYKRDRLRGYLRDIGLLDEKNILDVNGVPFDFGMETGYGGTGYEGDGRLQNAGEEYLINSDPNSYAGQAAAEGRDWHAGYDVDLTDPEAIKLSQMLAPFAWGIAGTDERMQGDLTGYLTNALRGGGLDSSNASEYLTNLRNKVGILDSNQMYNAAYQNIKDADWLDQWEKFANMSNVSGIQRNITTQRPGFISEPHRAAFLESAAKELTTRGLDASQPIIDANGYVIGDAANIYGIKYNPDDPNAPKLVA